MASNDAKNIPPFPSPTRPDPVETHLGSRTRTEPLRSSIILVSIPVLIVLFTYFGSNDFYKQKLSTPESFSNLHGYIYHHLGAFGILGVGSLLLGSVLGFRPGALGLGLGDWRYGLKFCAVVIPLLVVPITLAGSYTSDVIREYPVAKEALAGPKQFAIHAAFYLFYYVGWEFFFRGYSLFGLAGRLGKWPAIMIQTIPSTVIHTSIVSMGKPFGETLGAVPAGIIFGWLSLRTKSIWYAFAIHASFGVLTDLWLFLRN